MVRPPSFSGSGSTICERVVRETDKLSCLLLPPLTGLDGEEAGSVDMESQVSRMSLDSPSSSQGSHLHGRAPGVAGLLSRGGRGRGGGRAGLAKRNLAVLAPTADIIPKGDLCKLPSEI